MSSSKNFRKIEYNRRYNRYTLYSSKLKRCQVREEELLDTINRGDPETIDPKLMQSYTQLRGYMRFLQRKMERNS